MRGECPVPFEERGACPVLAKEGECYSDTDHRTPQRYRKLGWLVRKYIDTPDNKEQLCRWEHLEKTGSSLEDPENCIPDEETMLGAVQRAYEAGQLSLNKKDRLRLVKYQQGAPA